MEAFGYDTSILIGIDHDHGLQSVKIVIVDKSIYLVPNGARLLADLLNRCADHIDPKG